jgi:hypothetical protein
MICVEIFLVYPGVKRLELAAAGTLEVAARGRALLGEGVV